jgi:hypothetical protein
MYQQGRRLGEHLHLGSDDFFAVAAFQAQCYLAAISAFSEVRPEHAWATLPVTNQSMLTTQVSTRTRLEVKCFTLIEAHPFRPENDASLHHMFLPRNSQSSTGTLRLSRWPTSKRIMRSFWPPSRWLRGSTCAC